MPDQKVHTLPVSDMQPNPLQPRGKIHKFELDELVASIKNYGVLEPLIVAHTPAGYQIIAGERRWRAAKQAGLKEVPVIIKETSPRGMLEMAIIENVQRVDLSAIDRAQAFQQLIRDFKFTTSQVADKVGKSMSFVSNSIKLLDLPDAIKDGLAGGQITEGHARAIASIPVERAMVDCYKQILRENASVRRAEDLARRYKENLGQTPQNTLGRGSIHSPKIDSWQREIAQIFSKKTDVKLIQSSRQTRLMLTFRGAPEETEDQIKKILSLAETNSPQHAA
jgi:ParB family chromosome partitioning protein